VFGPLVNPGTYTLRLTVDGQTATGAVTVQRDPRVQISASDLSEQLRFALTLRDEISRLARLVNRIRAVKKQLTDRNELLKDDAKAEPLIQLAKSMIRKLDDLEGKLHNPKAEVTYDILAQRGGAKLYSKLSD